MTTVEIERSIKEELRAADLLKYVDPEQEQFLQFPDGFFAEVVLNDGSKVAEVESVIRGVKERLRTEGVELDEIVRPIWKVAKIERGGPSVSFPGLEPAVRFRVALESGSLVCHVTVDVTEGALALIREKLHDTKAPEDLALIELVHEFMKMELSLGGQSYWDPRRDSRLELDAGAFMYLMGRRDSFERLKASIEAVFDAPQHLRLTAIRNFLRLVSMGGRKAYNFESVLADLPGPGGAFRPGDRLPTSNYELYSTLFDSEREVLTRFFLDHLQKAEIDFPELKSEFPDVLS